MVALLMLAVGTFTVDSFRFESGVTVPHVKIAFATYGRLNAARSNAVLAPAHFMVDEHGYDWLLGPGQALDTTRYFVITTEMFGNGISSSPSNTPEPFHGLRFPAVTIRDNVRIAHQLLTETLGVTHLEAIVGFAMGAQQAFQWAVTYPDFADRVVATAGTAKCYPHGVVMLEGAVAALTADEEFKEGDYANEPKRGIHALGTVWAGWLFSQEWWRRELWRSDTSRGRTFDDALARLVNAFAPRDANDMISQVRTWEHQDISEQELRAIRARVLYMPVTTDLYFPIGDARYEAQFIPHVTFVPIRSLWGHPAGAAASPADSTFLNRTIGRFILTHDPRPVPAGRRDRARDGH
jgi:homoserine O-acetyltransferase